MNKNDVEKTIANYLKPIFGFALKRCKNAHDAEDLSQDILLKAFKAMLIKDDIDDIGKFIWTIAHNSLSNYYRNASKSSIGISIDEISEVIADTYDAYEDDTKESISRLRSEIAYLSKLQRNIIIAYYFENKKQTDIAKEFSIPLGTVKWHLFEAKKELKRGMNTMRKASDLKFNPIKFNMCSIVGSIGTETLDKFFRSSLSQNICYCIRDIAKTVNEISDDLGVSPVYVESEIEHLEKYGYLIKQKDKYIINFIIDIPTSKLLNIQNKMYRKAAKLFANDLYDILLSSEILKSNSIISPETNGERDINFLLWTMIPYITAISGENIRDNKISFDEVATVRADGAKNICQVTIDPGNLIVPSDYVQTKNWCGPANHNNDNYTYWTVDSNWSERRLHVNPYDFEKQRRVLNLYEKSKITPLGKDDCTWLAENGYIKMDNNEVPVWQIVILDNINIKNKLLSIGTSVKEKLLKEFNEIKLPYAEEYYNCIPKHMKKIAEYQMQFTFHCDGNFILYCINELLENGKLKEPTDDQRKSLSILITPNDN